MSGLEDSADAVCPEEADLRGSMMSALGLGQLTPHDYDLQQSNLALLKAELKLVTRDRDILQKELNRFQQHQPGSSSSSTSSPYRLPLVSGTLPRRLPSGQGAAMIDRSPSTSSVRDYEQIQQHNEAAARAMKESEYYQRQHRQAMTKLDSATQEMDNLRAKYMDLLTGKQRLEQEIHILSQAREEDRKEINELRRQQQESVIKGNGSSETLNQLYVNTVRKYEAIKDEHDSLRKRYTDLVASHSAAVSKLELAQEEMTRLKKQYEESVQERNTAVRENNVLKQQCTQAIMQWDNAIRERNTYKDVVTKMRAQHDEEVGKVMEIHMKASKDLKRLTDERNAAMEEYSLVMRERDTVHKEIEKLQDDLQQSSKRIKLLESKNKELTEEKEVWLYQTESLRREILSALHDRDTALKDLHDIREKYGDYKKDQRNENSLLPRKNDYEGDRLLSGNGVDSVRKDRGFEAPKSGRGESMDMEGQQEVEQLRKLVEKFQGELQEALQEAEVSKRRRDWAFGERDKVVLERESIRTLCDRLRRERDRAVSELAEALRDSDDIKRQRNDVSKELKELKEKIGELQMEKDKDKEKDSRPPHNHSYDSALGTDLSDAETETVEVEIDFTTDDLGFSLAGGKSHPLCPNDCALYVVSVARGSPAEGKLRVSDCLMKVGNVSCSSTDAETAYSIIRSSKSPIVLTLKRKRSQSQGLYSVKLNVFGGVQHGIVLENGVYIKSVVSGSIAARETTLKSGDRLCGINGRPVDSFTGLDEVCRVLDDLYQNEGLVITVIRGSSFPNMYPLSLPSLGSPSSSSSAHNITEDDNGDSQYSSANLRSRSSPRGDTSASKSAKLSASHRSSTSSNGGFGPWDMIRDRFTRIRRPHSKERVEHEVGESKRDSVSTSGISAERDAAIAELESVIENYNQQSEVSSERDSNKMSSSSKPDFLTLNRRSRTTASQKSSTKREEMVSSSGGTWPRCRAGSPLTSAYLHSGTLFNQKYSRGRPTLSIFTNDPKSSKDDMAEESSYKRRPETTHGSKYHVCENCSSDVGCLVSAHAPSDTSIDFSVKSGNLGKEVLEYYVKKKNPNSGRSDLDGGRVSQASVSVSESTTPASGLSSPVHVHSAMPAASHLRIHSQLYGCPSTIHSSIKYKVPHVHHPHNPPRYSSPPPLPRPSSEAYDSPYLAPLSANSYSHAPSPSIDSVYSRPTLVPSHTHAPSFRVSDDRVSRPECVHLPFDSVSGVKRDPPRIRIPSNQSVTSRSSIEKLSERGSPMPNFHVEVLSPGRGGGDNRSSLSEYYSSASLKFKPALGELRRIYIEKSSKQLGIQIFCRNSGGVFVSSVQQTSLAAQVGLQVGDQLLEVCGINMRSATYQLAANVLRQCGDSVTMLVQYNLAKYQELTSSGFMGSPLMTSSGSEGDNSGQNDRCHRSRSGTPTPCNSPCPSRNNSNNSSNSKDDVIDSASSTLRSPLHLDLLVERNTEARSSLVRPPSIHGTLTRHHALSSLKRPTSVVSPSNTEDCREPRLVLLDMKNSHNLGISLVGGNAVGIYLHAVQPDSPAHQAGLRCGDRILEFNGVNLRDATAEQAAYELAKPAEKVTLVVQHDIERYREIAEQPGDSFYVRAQFDKPSGERADPMELYFRRDDILYIDNTMFNGVPGLWRAWLVDQEGRKIRCGVIPSKFKIEEEILQRSSLGDLDHDSRRSSTSARRSFFRRRKHNRSSSRDSKELASFSDASLQMGSAEGLGLGLICMQENSPQRPLSYVIVDRMDCHNIRPLIIVGPLADCVVDKLAQDFPRKFVRVAAEVMRVPQSYMEKGLEENVFVEYRRRGSHYECITAAAVQEICDRNLHGVLDISLNAVERLHALRVYPIVLLLKFKSVKHVREVKDARLLSDKMAAKAAKEMYEHVIKVESEHRHLISNVVQAGGNLACICTQVAAAVDQEQNKVLWVPRVSTW